MTPEPQRPVLGLLASHWLSMLGAALVTTAGFSWLLLLPLNIRGHVANPYIGLLTFIIIPVFFFIGLACIPIGFVLAKRKITTGLSEIPERRTTLRRIGIFFAIMTFLNAVIGSQVTYRAVEHMETVQFCGQTCHVMKPELTAHRSAAHQQVSCVSCHVEPGATGWFKSKVAGIRQLKDVVLNTHPYPILSAMEENRLAPASETCEQCHWREKAIPSRLRIIPKYKDDEGNTLSYTVLMMLIGGGRSGGIHGAHLAPGVHMRYAAADAKRQTIPWVEYHNDNTGETRQYLAADAQPNSVSALPKFDLQCVDCHNRPTHAFEVPERALDRAMASGKLPADLPYLKKSALEALKTDYKTEEEAAKKIPEALGNYYRQNYADLWTKRAADIDRAGKTLLGIYNENVFPDLRVTWSTYPNNLGHTDYPGCFRCHDDNHATSGKRTISQDCGLCHQALAVEESSPEILKTLAIQNNKGDNTK